MFCEEGTLLPLADLRPVCQSGSETVEDREEAKTHVWEEGSLLALPRPQPRSPRHWAQGLEAPAVKHQEYWQVRCEVGQHQGPLWLSRPRWKNQNRQKTL